MQFRRFPGKWTQTEVTTIALLLTIAGHDPSSGAGITADLAVFAAHGYFGTSAITALTVQSTLGVQGVRAVDSALLAETLRCLEADLPLAGIKLGMLASERNVRVAIDFIAHVRAAGGTLPIVLDPVVRSSSGAELLSPRGVALVREELLPLSDWVTPNLTELAALAGTPVQTPQQMESAAASLAAKYPGLNVVATGGHLETADDLVLQAGRRTEWLRGAKIDSRATHGTGCAFSSALLCSLVQGLDGLEAARRAKSFVTEAIRRAVPIGGGHGPMNLQWPLQEGKRA